VSSNSSIDRESRRRAAPRAASIPEANPDRTAVPESRSAPAPRSETGASRLLLAVALVVAFTTIFLRLGGMALMDPDEGRNAEVASEMEQSGSWLVPTYNDLDYLDKPAFFFKAVALSFAAFGRSEMAARLPSALFAAGTLALAYFFCRREYGKRGAAYALMIVATTPLFLAFARIVIFDMTLCFFVCAALCAGYMAEEEQGAARKRWYLAGAAAAGFATLVKGPVGFIVPALVLSVFNLIEGRRRAILRLLAPLNLLVFFGIVLPWFLGLVHERPDFAYYGLVLETFKRFTSPIFHRTQPFYYYGPVILGAFLSWSLLYPEGIAAAWRARARLLRSERFLIVWAIVVVVFFSISQSKLPGYILSATVALGILTARLFERAAGTQREGRSVRAAAVVLRGTLVLGAVCFVFAAALGLELLQPGFLQRTFARAQLAPWSPIVVPAFAAMLLVVALAAYARARRNTGAALAAFVAMPLGVMVSGFAGFVNYADAHSSRDLARRIEAAAPGAEVACLACFPQGLTLYLDRRVTLISGTGEEMSSNYVLYRLKEHPPWPAQVVPYDERDRWLAARKEPVVVVASQNNRGLLDSIGAEHSAGRIDLGGRWDGVLIQPRGGR
jgi:4-amino-4-deoxy-L-arabinose transferase-like glycosyltransferase